MSDEPKSTKLVGSAIRRKEDPDILLGEARYTQDVTLPRMLHAVILRSPYAHARIRKINLDRALALPGKLSFLLVSIVRRRSPRRNRRRVARA